MVPKIIVVNGLETGVQNRPTKIFNGKSLRWNIRPEETFLPVQSHVEFCLENETRSHH